LLSDFHDDLLYKLETQINNKKKKRKDREMVRERGEVKERVREKYRDGRVQKKKKEISTKEK